MRRRIVSETYVTDTLIPILMSLQRCTQQLHDGAVSAFILPISLWTIGSCTCSFNAEMAAEVLPQLPCQVRTLIGVDMIRKSEHIAPSIQKGLNDDVSTRRTQGHCNHVFRKNVAHDQQVRIGNSREFDRTTHV